MKKDNVLIVWSSTFSCGIRMIDEQHKKLIEIVNDLFSHVNGNEEQECEYFNKVIHGYIDYIKIHFATEERLMCFIKFESYISHKREHDNFLKTIADSVRTFNTWDRVSLSTLARFLRSWILSHIVIMDKGYFEYLNKMASRKTTERMCISTAEIRHKHEPDLMENAESA